MFRSCPSVRIPLLRISAAVVALALALPTMAQVSSLIFERADIRIHATTIASEGKDIGPARPPIALSIELRPEESLRLEYIHTLNTLTPESGVMIVLNSPAILTLPAMKVYTAVDALFVAADGTITQIAPNVVLGEMTQDVQARKPVQAILFLQAGAAAARGIRPRDVIAGKMFTPSPAMQE